MVDKGLLIVISGPSGAGKGTLCKALLNKRCDLSISVSMTTRSPRAGEVEGRNYFFVDKDKFESMIEKNGFLEYACVYDNYYGTPREYVENLVNSGKDVILEIDIQGALKVKEVYPEGVFIFILPPSMEELKNRIKKRGSETEESLILRFKSAYKELNYVSKYNYVVINDTVDNSVEKLHSIIIAEKCRVDRYKDSILNSKEGLLHEQFYD
ncbi:guanylate kinase [Oxobacter pfennigii]|uniref:Guanylate kinase n=1 Tax=Oxobacter pfennigii TaxID=36849 RepID=A0A0P8YAI0_9CLOT|nr:guanylate kinase [Oxobacter pfennigii]KPU43983.1 guanylate kinase [Oxobacter pfennigii]